MLNRNFFFFRDTKIATDTQHLIRGILQLHPDDRLTAAEVRKKLDVMIHTRITLKSSIEQCVPVFTESPVRTKPKYRVRFSDDQHGKMFAEPPSLKPFVPQCLSFSQILELERATSTTYEPPPIMPTPFVPGLSQNQMRSMLSLHDRTTQNQRTHLNFPGIRNQWTNSNNSLAINQQMSNLTIRNQQELRRNLSWHDVRNYSNGPRNNDPRYNILLNPRVVDPNRQMFTTYLQSIDPLGNGRFRTSNINHDPYVNPRHNMVKNLITTFTETFIQGRIPTINRAEIREFDGVVTPFLAQRITDWLRTELMNNPIIRSIFSDDNETEEEKVLELLRRLGFHLEVEDGITKMRREQTIDLLLIMTYMLQAAGYNNSYFIA